jgi:hypothetical protein
VDTLASCENYLKREKNRTEVTEGIGWIAENSLMNSRGFRARTTCARKASHTGHGRGKSHRDFCTS